MIGWLILAAVLALCAVLCIRAARFKPEAGAGAAPTPVAVDTEGAVQRLAQLVRIPTVSNYDAEKFDETQFEGFREKLRELYPRVHEMCPPVRIAHTGMLCRAVADCEKHQFKAHLTAPVRALFQNVGPYAPFGLRLVFANLWLFGPLLPLLAGRLGGELGAMMRTTMAFTTAQGSKQINVLPTEASAGVNLRLVNLDTPESAAQHLKDVIRNDKVEVKVTYAQNASPYASAEDANWETLAKAVGDTWQGSIVSPYLMMACSDSRHFSAICRDVYKFSAMALSKEQRGLIHNNDERIPVREIAKTVEFFTRLEQSI